MSNVPSAKRSTGGVGNRNVINANNEPVKRQDGSQSSNIRPNILSENRKELKKLTRNQRSQKKLKSRILQAKYKATLVDKPPEKTESQKSRLDLSVALSQYSQELHEQALRWMWIPLKYTGQIPFNIIKTSNSYRFQTNRRGLGYILSVIQTLIIFIFLVWMSIGLLFTYFGETSVTSTKCPKLATFLHTIEKIQIQRYLLEIILIWSMLLHSFVSNLHLVLKDHDYVSFWRDWYSLVNAAQVRIHFGVRRLILIQYLILIIFMTLIIFLWALPYYQKQGLWVPPTVFGSSNAIGLSMMKLFQPNTFYIGDRGEPLFHRWSALGLTVQLLALFTTRLNLLHYIVSCRLLQNAALYYNKRINMALGNEEAEGNVASRLDVYVLYRDHVEISTVAKKIGKIFTVSVFCYYGLMLLNLVTETFTLGYTRYRKDESKKRWSPKWSTWEQLVLDDHVHEFMAHMGHLLISFASFLYITNMAIGCSDECMRVFEIVRRHGLLKCRTEQGRNFIRSMWISGDTRKIISISPGNFFEVDRTLICGTVMIVLLFFTHVLPLRILLEKYAGSTRNVLKNYSKIIETGDRFPCMP